MGNYLELTEEEGQDFLSRKKPVPELKKQITEPTKIDKPELKQAINQKKIDNKIDNKKPTSVVPGVDKANIQKQAEIIKNNINKVDAGELALTDLFKKHQKATEEQLGSINKQKDKELSEVAKKIDNELKNKKDARERMGWFRIAEQFGNLLTQYGAAQYGLKHGVDMSGLKFKKADFTSVLNTQLASINDRIKILDKEEKGITGKADKSSSRLTKLRDRLLEAKLSKGERADKASTARNRESIKLQQKQLDRMDSTTKDNNEMEDKMRKEWAGSPVTKDTQKIASSYRKIESVINNTPSPAGDISLIFNYMKMLDPASVVREGEQATAAAAGAVPDRVLNLYNTLIGGEKLSPSQRKDFEKQANRVFEGQLDVQDTVDNKFKAIAKRRKINIDNILDDSLNKLGKKEMSKEDKAALKWLKDNPNDEKADRVRKQLGIK